MRDRPKLLHQATSTIAKFMMAPSSASPQEETPQNSELEKVSHSVNELGNWAQDSGITAEVNEPSKY